LGSSDNHLARGGCGSRGHDQDRAPEFAPDDLVGVCRDISILTSAWESNIALKLMSYEEALAPDPIVASWISFSQNASLGSHTYILEDGPLLPAVSDTHADE
jgi:hypothetical protein